LRPRIKAIDSQAFRVTVQRSGRTGVGVLEAPACSDWERVETVQSSGWQYPRGHGIFGSMLKIRRASALVFLLFQAALAMSADAEQIVALELGERMRMLAAENPEALDLSETYYVSENATVHMHVMGRGQMCPLHIHRVGDEATVIVAGLADVTQIHGPELSRTVGRQTPGSVAASPMFCGHEFVNPSREERLGNLVFSTPPFDTNLYIRADDPRQREGGAPFRFDTDGEWANFIAGSSAQRLIQLPVMHGRMALLLVRREYTLAPPSNGPTVLYVMRGSVDVEAGEANRTLLTRYLAKVEGGVPIALRTEEGAALVVFAPEIPARANPSD
jgi:hypothetical protein